MEYIYSLIWKGTWGFSWPIPLLIFPTAPETLVVYILPWVLDVQNQATWREKAQSSYFKILR